MTGIWKCSGCGAPSPDRERTCDCVTASLYREGDNGNIEHAVKIGARAFPRPLGVSRVADNDHAVLVALECPPSDQEMRNLHQALRAAY